MVIFIITLQGAGSCWFGLYLIFYICVEDFIYYYIWDGYMKLNDVHIHENLVICVKAIGFQVLLTLIHAATDRNPDTLVHIKLVGRWMFKPPKMVPWGFGVNYRH